jgi:hypothetical protein
MRAFTKKKFAVSQIRRFLEPGPIVLVSSASKGKTNIMTMGWHTVMEFEPSLVGCMISRGVSLMSGFATAQSTTTRRTPRRAAHPLVLSRLALHVGTVGVFHQALTVDQCHDAATIGDEASPLQFA